MAQHLIVAQFDDYGAAHRAFVELLQTGIRPNEVSIVAGDRSNMTGASRDFGILEDDGEDFVAAVRRGRTLLAVRAEEGGRARIADIIRQHAPAEIEERAASGALAPPRG
jgi:hypothetical protein